MANLNLRVDDDLKKEAEVLFAQLGLNMSTAMIIFLKKAVSYGGIPFELRISDPFYSPENQTRLRKTITEYNLGDSKLITKTMKELEDMENE